MNVSFEHERVDNGRLPPRKGNLILHLSCLVRGSHRVTDTGCETGTWDKAHRNSSEPNAIGKECRVKRSNRTSAYSQQCSQTGKILTLSS